MISLRNAAIHEARRVLARKPIILELMPTSLNGSAEICAVAAVNWRGDVLFDDVIRPAVSISRDALTLYAAEHRDFVSAPTFRDVWDGYLRSVLAGERTAPDQPLCVWLWPHLYRALIRSLSAYDLRIGYIKPPLEVAALAEAVMGDDARMPDLTVARRCEWSLRMLRAVAEQASHDVD